MCNMLAKGFFLLLYLTLSFQPILKGSDSLTVHLFLLDECKICRSYFPILNTLHTQYNNQGVGFIGYFPNFSSKKANIDQLRKVFGIPYPLKTDYFKGKAKHFGATVTPEVFLVREPEGEVIYRGRIDNSYARIGVKRGVVTTHDLDSAIKAALAGREIPVDSTNAVGCFINFNDMINLSSSQEK